MQQLWPEGEWGVSGHVAALRFGNGCFLSTNILLCICHRPDRDPERLDLYRVGTTLRVE